MFQSFRAHDIESEPMQFAIFCFRLSYFENRKQSMIFQDPSSFSCRYSQWIEDLDQNPLNYDFLLCTTADEIQRKYPDGDPRETKRDQQTNEAEKNLETADCAADDD